MTIDEVIHEKIRRRFDLPAKTPVGYRITACHAFDGDLVSEIDVYRENFQLILANYYSWHEFVNDLERSNDG